MKNDNKNKTTVELKHIIIHQAIKDAGSRDVELKLASGALNIDDREISFIEKVNKAYYKKSCPTYGIFGDSDPQFQNYLKEYRSDNNFYGFTQMASKHYKKILEETPQATGAFLIYAHYINKENGNEYMLVLTINNKKGFVVNESNLTLVEIKNLDLGKVDVACMINISKWKQMDSGIDIESKTYLSFIKGNKSVSFYFLRFIDCNDKTTSEISTMRLIKAIDAFCDKKQFDRELKIKKKNEIFLYCEKCINDKKEILLSAISALFDNENSEEFQLFASEEEYGVNPIISGDKAKLKTMRYVIYKGSKLSIEFDSDLLDKDVFYDFEKNELLIKNLNESLVKQIPR